MGLKFFEWLAGTGGRTATAEVTCQELFDAAADLSVILTWWQLTDGVADHGFFRGLPYRAALLALSRAYRKARVRRPGFDERTRAHLEELARLDGQSVATLSPTLRWEIRNISGVCGELWAEEGTIWG